MKSGPEHPPRGDQPFQTPRPEVVSSPPQGNLVHGERRRTSDAMISRVPQTDQTGITLPGMITEATPDGEQLRAPQPAKKPRRSTSNAQGRYLSGYLATQRANTPPLEEQQYRNWGIKDSSLIDPTDEDSYGRYFKYVLPEGTVNLKTYIEEVIGDRWGEAIGIDLGGPGSLFAGFPEGLFKKTMGITLHKDFRDDATKARDEARKHTVHQGDIFDEETQRMVREFAPEGVHVMFEKLVGAQDDLSRDPLEMMRNADNCYGLLSKTTGLLFAQIPFAFYDPNQTLATSLRNLIPRWHNLIQTEHPELEVQTSRASMRLRTLMGAPNHLPRLSPRDFLTEEKMALQRRTARMERVLGQVGLPQEEIAKQITQLRKEHLL